MKASYLGISGLMHLAIVALICFAAFETVSLTEQPRELRETEIIDLGKSPGPGGSMQAQGNTENSGPRIRTPRIKIPHFNLPTAEERAAAEAEAAQTANATTKPTTPVRTPPKPNGPRMTQAEFEAAHPSKPGKVNSVKPASLPAANSDAAKDKDGSDKPGQNGGAAAGDEGAGGAAFDQIVCQRIKAALDSYKASRDDLKVFVSFVITASGRLTAASLQQSSGDASFDQAALAALRQVSVAPVPKDYVGQLLAVTISSKD